MKTLSLTMLMHMLEFTDSAFPVGLFSFSNGVETAAETGEIVTADDLREFACDLLHRSAMSDGVAGMCALRACKADDYESLVEVDECLYISKLNAEARQMTQRTGRKTAELADRILADNAMWRRLGSRWLADIGSGYVQGTQPVTLGVVFAACGLSERELFCSLCYGTLNTVLSAALRCVRVSHYDTQAIMFDLSGDVEELYARASEMGPGDMNAFSPQADILASMHEKGNRRMFMN